MARKQTCSKKILSVAQFIALIYLTILAASVYSQQARRASGTSAPSAVAVVEREITAARSTLDSVRAELERGRAQLAELQSEEGNYLERLDLLSSNIATSGHYIELAQKQIDTVTAEIEQLSATLAKEEDGLFTARQLMIRRIRAAYMSGGEMSRLQMLLTAASPTEFLYRIRYFQELNRHDRRLAESIRERIVNIDKNRAEQEAARRELYALLEDKTMEQQTLLEEEAERRVMLEDIRSRREASAAIIAELEAAHAELDQLMQVLESRRRRAREEEERRAVVNFENRKGRLEWPVDGGTVISRFGRVVHPVYRTVIMNNGIGISANKGAPVRAVAPGSVAFVGWMRGLGRLIILDHGGGFMTLYAHLDEVLVAQDQSVTTGMEIGRVGETGTAGGPKLHFEIRKAAESMNPEEWLISR